MLFPKSTRLIFFVRGEMLDFACELPERVKFSVTPDPQSDITALSVDR